MTVHDSLERNQLSWAIMRHLTTGHSIKFMAKLRFACTGAGSKVGESLLKIIARFFYHARRDWRAPAGVPSPRAKCWRCRTGLLVYLFYMYLVAITIAINRWSISTNWNEYHMVCSPNERKEIDGERHVKSDFHSRVKLYLFFGFSNLGLCLN